MNEDRNTMKYSHQIMTDEIARMCSALDALAPEEGEDRDDVEGLIKTAHGLLARMEK
jgi:hypothetical protein